MPSLKLDTESSLENKLAATILELIITIEIFLTLAPNLQLLNQLD